MLNLKFMGKIVSAVSGLYGILCSSSRTAVTQAECLLVFLLINLGDLHRLLLDLKEETII